MLYIRFTGWSSYYYMDIKIIDSVDNNVRIDISTDIDIGVLNEFSSV